MPTTNILLYLRPGGTNNFCSGSRTLILKDAEARDARFVFFKMLALVPMTDGNYPKLFLTLTNDNEEAGLRGFYPIKKPVVAY